MTESPDRWTGVPSWAAELWWNEAGDRIAAALDHAHGELSILDVRRAIAVQDMQLWMHPKAACVTQIVNYPQMKSIRVVALGGDGLEGWLDELWETLVAFATKHGARRVEMAGRKGWLRALKRLGWRETYVMMAADL